MTNEEIVKELKETGAKIEGILNILRRSPVILANNKLTGLYQKIVMLADKIEHPSSADSAKVNEDC